LKPTLAPIEAETLATQPQKTTAMNEQPTGLDTLMLPENLAEKMAMAAERLWRLLEQRRKLMEDCKTIPPELGQRIREANDNYIQLQQKAEQLG